MTPSARTAATAQPAAGGALAQPTARPTPSRPTTLPGTTIRFEGGAGTSVDDAIVIRGAHGEEDGTGAEYKYLEMVYGPRGSGYKVAGQSLMNQNGKSFDRLDVEVNGKPLAVYFDITDYFGKL